MPRLRALRGLPACALAALLLAVGVSCSDSSPFVPHLPEPALPTAQAIVCRAAPAAGTVECDASLLGRGTGPAFLIAGGQGINVRLASSNVNYDEATEAFTFDVTVENLIGQALGTPDGTTVTGLRVFFHSGPTVSGGTGTVNVLPDGFETITGSGQPYYGYPQILQPGETSDPRTWTLAVAATVTSFEFSIYVSGDVEYPQGWMSIAAADTLLELGDESRFTTPVTATVWSVLGREVEGASVTFSSSAPGVAIVDADGLVEAQGVGVASITATAGSRSATVDVRVTQTPVPHAGSLVLSTAELTADGESQALVTVTLHDGRGNRLHHGGHDLAIGVTNLNVNTPGGTVTAVTDHGDGTYTAALTGFNNGAVTVRATLEEVIVDGAPLTFVNGNNIPQVPPPACLGQGGTCLSETTDSMVYRFIEDSEDNLVRLLGHDPDGDPLTATITYFFAQSPDASLVDSSGASVAPYCHGCHPDIDDLELLFTPQPDGYGVAYARIHYMLDDGKARSDTTVIIINVIGVNDPPRPTLPPDLHGFEDTFLHFSMGGDDPELHTFHVRFVRNDFEWGELPGSLYHLTSQGPVLITEMTTFLQGSSNNAGGWPMRFVPDPDDWKVGTEPYSWFCYVLQEAATGLFGPENCVNIWIHPVNDAPETAIAGIGRAVNHTLTATAVRGGVYTLPALSVTDADIHAPHRPNPRQEPHREFAVRIETTGNGALLLDTFDYEDAHVVFSVTDTLITFTMPWDVSNRGFVPGLTLDNLLSSLRYSPVAGSQDVLVITIGDQGATGRCSPTDATDPCPRQSVTTITVQIQDGTPPPADTPLGLTPGG